MTTRKVKLMFQKQVKQYNECCCVPMCPASSKYNGLLSFHGFPQDTELRRQWLVSIHLDKLNVTTRSKVCSLHFAPDQMIKPKTAAGKRMLHKGAVPVLFQWNHYSIQPPRASEQEGVKKRPEPGNHREYDPTVDHDYCSVPEPTGPDMAVNEHFKLKKEKEALRTEIEELKSQPTFGLQRFAGSDDDIRFYTRFASYRHFMMFWRLIEPFVHKMIRSSRAGAAERRNEGVTGVRATHTRHSLQPVDELFLFQMFLAAGLEERDLANRFNIHTSTVSHIISSWTNFLYALLGSLCIWIDAEDIQGHLPDDFKDFSDTRVIVDCTELKCQTPACPVPQSEVFFKHKSHCTMKALVGMAPHGAVTFVSSLYKDSISDKELFMRSGLADLLTEDMAVMVDKGSLVPDCVKCKVYRLPFLSKLSQMPTQNVRRAQKIARLRVHVERVMRRVMENKLFDSVIPLSIVGSINELFTVACLLVNYQNKPLVKGWAE